MKLLTTAALTLALSVGCAKPAEDGSSTSPDGSPPSAEDVKREVGEAAEAATEFASQKKDEYAKALRQKLDELDTSLEDLKQKAGTLTDEAKARWEANRPELERKREDLNKKLDELEASSGDAWEHVKDGLDSAWNDLKKAADEAAKEFD